MIGFSVRMQYGQPACLCQNACLRAHPDIGRFPEKKKNVGLAFYEYMNTAPQVQGVFIFSRRAQRRVREDPVFQCCFSGSLLTGIVFVVDLRSSP